MAVLLDGSASEDPQGRPLTFAWGFVALPAGSTVALNDATATKPSFVPDLAGAYVAWLTVSNGIFASAPARLTVTVTSCGAAPPAVDAIAAEPAMPATGQVVELSSDVTDADNAKDCTLDPPQTFAYAWSLVDQPAGSEARLTSPSSKSPSFVADVPGDYEVALVVTDSAGVSSAPAPFTVTVSACGDAAPSVEAVTADPPAPDTGEAVQLSATVVDADTEDPCALAQTIAYAWAIAERPVGSTAGLSDAAARNPSFTPDVPGDYVVELVARDSTGRASAPAGITVTASVCGSQPPAIASVDVAPDAPNTGDVVLLEVTASDPDNDECGLAQTLGYAWSFVELPSGSVAAFNDAGAATPSFLADAPGTYVAEVVVADSTGLSAVATVEIEVDACGSHAPIVGEVTHDPASPNTFALVTLAAEVSDDDNDDPACDLAQAIGYEWSIVDQPPGSLATLNNPAAESPSLVADVPGDYAVVVVATDVTGRSSAPAPHTFSVSTCGSAAPTAALSASTLAPATGQAVQFTATISDADAADPCLLAESFSYEWSLAELPVGSLAAINEPSAANPSFVPDVPGAYRVALVVTDGAGLAGAALSEAIVASTCGANAPSTGALSASTTAPAVGQAVQLTAPAASDADNLAPCSLGQTLAYAWSFTELPAGSLATLNDPAATNPSFVPDVTGTYRVQLALADSTGRQGLGASPAVIASTCGANAPSIGTLSASTAAPAVGQAVQLTAPSASDADNLAPCSLGQTLA
ncbi:MAG: hypothetical protein AABZ30_11305, partial [Myxococcota bacterium]